MRQRLIGAGFRFLEATGAHRLAAPALAGLGAILMFHHVRPWQPRPFAPNRLLEITPDFLDGVIAHLRERGYDVVSMDAAMQRLSRGGRSGRPFAVLTFDDGYSDNLRFALPVLERHAAPFTVFVTTGFADRTARLWWLELEEAVRRASRIAVTIGPESLDLPAATAAEKAAAFDAIYRRLRSGPEERLRAVVGDLCRVHGVDGEALVAELCMDWPEIACLSRNPLATIGAHTLTHPRLAWLHAATMRAELAESRAAIEAKLGSQVRFLAYPVGDPASAGGREFAAAADLGYEAAVTTRPGLVHREHAQHPTALPRVSINGLWQDLRHVDVLLSGLAFALWNRGRRVGVA